MCDEREKRGVQWWCITRKLPHNVQSGTSDGSGTLSKSQETECFKPCNERQRVAPEELKTANVRSPAFKERHREGTKEAGRGLTMLCLLSP